ncbi:MAG: LuxR C-terminal-related transcriptional regulator [Aequorivita sp.]|nr:LuxR C-terminal-related transcriptional regulator [Aequorivita sp.]
MKLPAVLAKKIISFLGFLFVAAAAQSQTFDTVNEVKLQIDELLGNKEITLVNELVKDNTSLPPAYILETLTETLLIAKENNDARELANTYIILGNFWFQQGNNVKAYNYLLQAETIVRNLTDSTLLGRLLMNKGNATENLPLKIATYKEAIVAYEKEDDAEGLSKVYLNIGDAYANYLWSNPQLDTSKIVFTSKDSAFYKETAFNYYKKADSINKTMDNLTIEGIVKVHIAEWYKAEKQFLKAKQTFTEAQAILEEADYPKGINYCILHLGSIETRLGNYNEAIAFLNQAEAMAKRYNYTNYLQGVYDEFVKAYDSLGNYQQALKYSRLNTKTSLELNNIQSKDKILSLNLEYNQKENEFKIERAEAKNKLNRALLSISIILLLLTIGMAYLMIKNKKRKVEIAELEKSSIQIKLNNKKLEEALLKEKVKFSQEHLVLFANQVNKIEEFVEKLKHTVKKLPKSTETQNIINKLKVSFFEILNGQNYLKQLNTFTTKINQDFFFYISKHYPGFTEEDEKLLSYIILDRSTKEISDILNISQASVYTKRYRLRQKLNLSKDDSFKKFYEDIMSKIN